MDIQSIVTIQKREQVKRNHFVYNVIRGVLLLIDLLSFHNKVPLNRYHVPQHSGFDLSQQSAFEVDTPQCL